MWYAVQVRSKQEWRVTGWLESKGYELFFPVAGGPGAGRRARPEALFPGYVFCRLEASRRLAVLTTPGVISLVASGKGPVPVPDDEIQNLRAIVNSGIPRQSMPLLAMGDRVRVTQGVLRGVEGILMREKSHWRLVISVSLLQRSVAADVDRDWVVPAELPGKARIACRAGM